MIGVRADIGDVAEALADATVAELRGRGATVVELPDGDLSDADAHADVDGKDAADADAAGSFDAVINVVVDEEGPGFSGTRVTGLYEGADGFADPGTADLAAGIRDALVFHRFSPGNRYDEEGRPGDVVDGLSPAFGTPSSFGTPEVIVSAGNIDDPAEAKALETREWRVRYARGIADGIASMLRQS